MKLVSPSHFMYDSLLRTFIPRSPFHPTVAFSIYALPVRLQVSLFPASAMPRQTSCNRRSARNRHPFPLGPNTAQFKKPSDSSSSKRKYYAVRRGLEGFAGVLSSWEECKLHVHGVPGASYKSFKTYEAAQLFTVGSALQSGSKPPSSHPPNSQPEEPTTASATEHDTVYALPPAADPPPDAPLFLTVYTDGACQRNGKIDSKAGYGVYFGEESPYNASEPLTGHATNQRAELTAVLEAMRIVREHGLVAKQGLLKIYTDSMYTKSGIESWIHKWKKNKWKTSVGANVRNKDLWLAIDSTKYALEEIGINVGLVWVRGHVGNPGNEAADRLAVEGCNREEG